MTPPHLPPTEPHVPGAFRTSSASRGALGPAPPAPLLRRALLLPFSPGAWRDAASGRLGPLIAALLVLSLAATALLGAVRGVDARRWLLDAGREYDARFDPVVVEGGRVRVEGERLPRWTESRSTILVDPEGTVSLEDLETPEYIVVRRDEVIRHQAFRDQSFPVAELMKVMGRDRLVVDGASIRAFGERWGGWIGLGVALAIALFGLAGTAVGCAVYGLASGALLFLLRRAAFEGRFEAAARVGLALSSIPVVVSLALDLLGVPLPCCLTTVAWPLLLTAVGLVAIGDRSLGVASAG